jgi:thioesterase domain-containing protein
VLYDAWLAYTARPYPGALSIVRATVRAPRLGVTDDDPYLGWSRLVGSGIRVADIQCDHMRMLEPENLPALATLLRGWLGATAEPQRAAPLALTA